MDLFAYVLLWGSKVVLFGYVGITVAFIGLGIARMVIDLRSQRED